MRAPVASVAIVAVKVPSGLKVGVKMNVLMTVVHGPCSPATIAGSGCVVPPPMVVSAAAEIVQIRPAPIAVPPLGSSPIQRLPAVSRFRRLVLAPTKAKPAVLAPVQSTPPLASLPSVVRHNCAEPTRKLVPNQLLLTVSRHRRETLF